MTLKDWVLLFAFAMSVGLLTNRLTTDEVSDKCTAYHKVEIQGKLFACYPQK